MRKLLGVIAACFLAAGVAGQAQAAALGFTGGIGLQVATLAPVTIVGAGTATVNGTGAGGHINTLSLAGGTFATVGYIIPVTDPAAAPKLTVFLTGLAMGGALWIESQETPEDGA